MPLSKVVSHFKFSKHINHISGVDNKKHTLILLNLRNNAWLAYKLLSLIVRQDLREEKYTLRNLRNFKEGILSSVMVSCFEDSKESCQL